MVLPPDPDALRPLLPRAWSSASSSRWRPDNPACGQCSVTALLAQELFGGEILKTRIGSAWHFYNRINGVRHDLTESQFASPVAYDDAMSNRTDAMADTSPEQYAALRMRVLALAGELAG